jgi:hypothetical protein
MHVAESLRDSRWWCVSIALFLALFSAFALVDNVASVRAADAESVPAPPEFGGQCPAGLSEGKRMQGDCSISWTDKDGKLYCFANAESRVAFLADPETKLKRAREFYAASNATTTALAMSRVSHDDVKTFVIDTIKTETAAHGGLYPFHDRPTSQTLALVFDKIDFMRTLDGYGFFPEAIFHAKDTPEKTYLIDFWVRPKTDQPKELTIVDQLIYKGPKRDGDHWTLVSRLPTPWWWLPASEHPGASEQVRAWEVMSAIDGYISQKASAAGDTYTLTDTVTGKPLSLELLGIHQPVRKLKDNGRYFACTDFRKKGGGPDEVYDLDFWVEDRGGAMTITDVKVHKVPEKQEGGNWAQVPRYSYDGSTYDEVP